MRIVRWIVLVAVVGLIAGVAAWQLSDDEAAGSGRDVLLTAPVERRTLRDSVTVRGTLERSEVRTVLASAEGRVSQVGAEDGATVAAGDTILAVEGRPSVAVAGELPFFRTLDVGAEGPDVRQLETILAEAGFDPGPVDVRYTEQTRTALAAWQAERGYPGTVPEIEETLTVSLSPGAGYTVGALASTALTIGPGSVGPNSIRGPGSVGPNSIRGPGSVVAAAAQALPVARLTTAPFTAAEGTSHTLTVELDPAPSADTAVGLVVSGTAVPGLDVSAVPSSVVVAAGQTTATVTVDLLDDDLVEPAEVLSLALAPGATYTVGTPAATQVTVEASAGDPVVTIRADTALVGEGTPAGFTIVASAGPDDAVDVALAYQGTATDGSDYLRAAGTLTLPADARTLTVAVPTLADTLVEPDETLVLVLVPGDGYQVGQPDRATTTIVSDDVPELNLTGGGAVAEGTARTLTVTADAAVDEDVLVPLTVGGSATPVTDYDPLPATVLLPAGATTSTVSVQTLVDDLGERPETVVVGLGPASGGAYRVGPRATQTVTVSDGADAATPVLAIRADSGLAAEGRPATFTVESDRRLDEELEVRVTLRGTATPGLDADAPAGRAVIAPGQRAVQLTVTVRDDDLVEDDEIVELALVASPDYRLGLQYAASTTVISDDLPELSVVGGGTVAEGARGGFTIVADQAPVEDTAVTYQVVGTAQQGQDLAPVPGTVVLPAGATSVGVPVRAIDDDVVFQPTDMIVGDWPARIGTVLVDEGQAVAPGAPLFSITETTFTITLRADATDRSELLVGQEVDVTIQAGGQETTGVITELEDVAVVDPATGAEQYEGTVEITEELAAVDGAAATLEVVLEERVDAIVVPIAAVSQAADGTDEVRVIDLEAEEFRRIPVETGLQEGAYIEITSGLSGDELLVVEIQAA